MEVECSLRDQLAALKFLQSENGLWHTILDDESSYEEVSASCGIAAAMIDNANPLHLSYVEKAVAGVLANITADGRVLNVSGGTAVMKDADGYKKVPKGWIQGWGQACIGFAFRVYARLCGWKINHGRAGHWAVRCSIWYVSGKLKLKRREGFIFGNV